MRHSLSHSGVNKTPPGPGTKNKKNKNKNKKNKKKRKNKKNNKKKILLLNECKFSLLSKMKAIMIC